MKNIHLLYLTAIIFFGFQSAKATHVTSTEAWVKCTNKTSTEISFDIHITQLRDLIKSTVQFDQNLEVGIYRNSDKTLEKTITVSLRSEEPIFTPSNSGLSFHQGNFTQSFSLPRDSIGYFMVYARCCIPVSSNIDVDQSPAILLDIPDNIEPGQYTLRRKSQGDQYVQKNRVKEYQNVWESNYYDSFDVSTGDFPVYGSLSNPIPALPSKYTNTNTGKFIAGAGPGNPFGNLGQWTKTGPNAFSIQFSQSGYYFYPVTCKAYAKGKMHTITRLFSVTVADTFSPSLHLKLESVENSKAHLLSNSVFWDKPGSLFLHRGNNPTGPFQIIQSNLADGINIPLQDSGLSYGNTYYYHLSRTYNGNTYYGDTIAVLIQTGVKNITHSIHVSIYPNPTQAELTITSDINGSIKVFASNGLLVHESEKVAYHHVLNLQDWPKGIYLISLNGHSYRFIKE